jgi:hypothetical protein
VAERFDCFRGTSKEAVARKFGVRGANVFARKRPGGLHEVSLSRFPRPRRSDARGAAASHGAGSLRTGHAVEVVLQGDAALLFNDTIAANVQPVGLPSLRELFAFMREKEIPVFG